MHSPRSPVLFSVKCCDMQTYLGHGIRFQYPAEWVVSEEEHGPTVNIHLQTPGMAFWMLTLLPSTTDVTDVVEAAVAAFEDEYEQVDRYDRSPEFDDLRTAGCDLDFVCLDLVNSACIRAVALTEHTALVLFQGEDRELETFRSQLDAVTESLCADLDAPQ